MEAGEYVIKRGEDFFIFIYLFFYFFFILLFTLKTTKICFKSTKMGIFYREKAFHAGKKSGKMTLPSQKNMPVTPLFLL